MPQNRIQFEPVDFEPIKFEPIGFEPIKEEPKKKSLFSSLWDTLNTTPKFITDRTRINPKTTTTEQAGGLWNMLKESPSALADIYNNIFGTPAYNPQDKNAARSNIMSGIADTVRGFGAGAIEGTGELFSPINVADAATGFGKSPALRAINKGVSAVTAAGGVDDLLRGNTAQGVMEIAGGLLGMRGTPKTKLPDDPFGPDVSIPIGKLRDIGPAETFETQKLLPEPKTIAPEILHDLPQRQKLLGSGNVDDIIEAEIINQTYNGPRQLSAGDRINPRALLPESTSIAGDPRFVSGRAGVVDTNLKYPFDTADPVKLNSPGTLTDAELGELVSLPHEMVAQGDPALPDMFAQQRSPGLKARDARELEAVKFGLKQAYSDIPFEVNPGNPQIRTGILDPSKLTPESKLKYRPGGEIVNPPSTIKDSGIAPFRKDTIAGEDAAKLRPLENPVNEYNPNRIDVVNRSLSPNNELPPVTERAYDPNKIDVIHRVLSDHVKPETATRVIKEAPAVAEAAASPEFVKKFVKPSYIKDIFSSVDSELSSLSTQLGRAVKQVQVDSHIKAGGWIKRYDDIVNKLKDNDFALFVRKIEDPNLKVSGNINEAVNKYRALDKEVSDEMTTVGTGLKSDDGTKLVPWQARDNYWPHIYDEDTLNKFGHNPSEIRARMMESINPDTKAKYTPAEIDKILDDSKRFGERLISSQHARESTLPGYRTDKEVYRQHLNEMAKRIEEARKYGAMDIADNNSPLMTMIRQSNNPEYATELMKKLLNRDSKINQRGQDITRKLTGIQAWMHLGMSGLSNLNSLSMTPIQANFKSFAGGLLDTFARGKQTGEFAKESGSLFQNIFHDIINYETHGSTLSPSKVYGLDAGEKFMRTVSAATGKRYAEAMFDQLKANPTALRSNVNKAKLQDLILENVDEVLKQPSLTDQQIKRAAWRMAELSQGVAEKQNLPKLWTDSATANILTLFHKYQFAQTKIVKDAIMKDPMRAIPMLLAASQIAGEVTGDAKAVVKGTIKGLFNDAGIPDSIYQELEDRGKFMEGRLANLGVEDDWWVSRIAENAAQSFALGMYADLFNFFSAPQTDMGVFVGSLGKDLSDLAGIARDLGIGTKQLLTGEDPTAFQKAGRNAVGKIPIVGSSIKQTLSQ